MWSEKYRFKNIDQFVGNEQSRLDVLKWIKNWIKGTKPLIMIGPPGTGKTSFITSMANFFNYDLVELNASDFRNKANLESIINPLLGNSSIFGKKILLFLDEVDGISGRDDSGGLSFLISTLKNSTIPIVMAANSKNLKIKELIKNSKMVEFCPLSPFSCYLLLQNLLTIENRTLDLDQKLMLIEKSNGDVRTLLNLVQSKLQGEFEPFKNMAKNLSVEDCVNLFFSAENISQAKKILIQSDILYLSPKFGSTPEERIRDIVYAMYSSIISNERKISFEDMAKILDGLSQVDLYVNKIYKNRNWHLLRYANDTLISKLFDVTRGSSIKYSQYNIPFPLIGSIFIRGQSTRMLGKILSKIFHTSSSDIGMFYFLSLITILKDFGYRNLFFNSPEDAKLNEIIQKEQDRLKKR
ncbi:MAG: AAA family ATPase [Candidatus Nitrosocosmicus sp.]